jgi:hypothetical protein
MLPDLSPFAHPSVALLVLIGLAILPWWLERMVDVAERIRVFREEDVSGSVVRPQPRRVSTKIKTDGQQRF